MTRRTKTPRIAVPRVADALDGITVKYVGSGRWRIRINGKPTGHDMRTIHALGFLADLAWRQGVDPAPIRFTGRAPLDGVPGWQADAINWLGGNARKGA